MKKMKNGKLIEPSVLYKHGQRELVCNTSHGATDPAVPAVPALFRIDHLGAFIAHGKAIAGAILHAIAALAAFIHINDRRHDLNSFLQI
jgi:hypothetical protein